MSLLVAVVFFISIGMFSCATVPQRGVPSEAPEAGPVELAKEAQQKADEIDQKTGRIESSLEELHKKVGQRPTKEEARRIIREAVQKRQRGGAR